MPTELQRSILQTFAFFDLFDYPLTPMETWKWLWKPPADASFGDVLHALDDLVSEGTLEKHLGFFVLTGRREIVMVRKQRHRDALAKWNKARRAIRLLSWFPFIRMAAVCNTLAFSHSRPEADIDLFIVAQAGRLWISRFLVTAAFHLLGLRPTGDHKSDTICLSFWVTPEAFDLSAVQIHSEDIYFRMWLSQLYPIYDPHGDYRELFEKNSEFLASLPHAGAASPHHERVIAPGRFQSALKKILERLLSTRFGSWLDHRAKRFQQQKFPNALRSQMNRGVAVVVNDRMMKFHDHDQRAVIYRNWQQRCEKIFASIAAQSPQPRTNVPLATPS